MPVQSLLPPPGVDTQSTPLLAGNRWVLSQFVRFFQSKIQKLGGWLRLISTPIIGTARAMLAWEDAVSNQYIAIGSEQAFEVYFNGVLYNVTPIMTTDTVAVSFSTVNHSATVKITDSTNPAVTGALVIVLNPISVGGLVLQGTYTIGTVIDANNYDITAASTATSTVNNGGAAALFTTTNTSATVKVTLNNHGYSPGGLYTVYVSTTVATIVLFGSYTVQTVIDANNFTITGSSTASASTTGSENGGDVTLQYLLAPGQASSSSNGGLYGEGPYGQGTYGIGSSETFVPARIWSFGYWGTDIVASFTDGTVYTWISESGLVNNPAVALSNAPVAVNAGIFTAMPQQQVVALGASVGNGSTVNQLLVRWTDVANNTVWTASATNQAGSFPIPRGAHIVGGMQGPQCGLIWTDVGLWLMQYVGFPLVYGFTEIGQGCGLIWQNAKGTLAGKVYWMSYNGFFVYDGNSVQPLPCSVWDKVFQNLNTLQTAKIIACPNSYFNEISWCYPSATGSGENDSRVTYNASDGSWTFDPVGAIVRTAWLDQSSLSVPLGVDGNGLIQQHEFAPDADGTAMVSYAQTGFIKIGEGQMLTFLERLIPDAILQNSENLTSTLQFTLYFQDYPDTGVIFTVGPLNYTQASTYLIVRGRGRLVSVRIESTDLGSFWRLGECLMFGSPAGRRP
jgi:hypothetical protein